jgi:GT2 family glycosyltransferase
MQPTVTVVLDAYGDYRRPDEVDVPFDETLRTLLAQSHPQAATTILITCSAAEVPFVTPLVEEEPRVRIVTVPDGLGYYQKKNLGARQSETDYVLFADGDCRYPETWAAEMVAAFERGGTRVAAVQGMSHFTGGPFADVMDTLYWAAYQADGPIGRIYSAHNLALSRETVARGLLFEETPLRAGLERLLSDRIRKQGLVIWHNRRTTVHHESSSSFREIGRRALARGHYRMILWRRHPNWLDRALTPLGPLGVPIYVLLVFLRDSVRQVRGLRHRGGLALLKLPGYLAFTLAFHVVGGAAMLRVLDHLARTKELPGAELLDGRPRLPDPRAFSAKGSPTAG